MHQAERELRQGYNYERLVFHWKADSFMRLKLEDAGTPNECFVLHPKGEDFPKGTPIVGKTMEELRQNAAAQGVTIPQRGWTSGFTVD